MKIYRVTSVVPKAREMHLVNRKGSWTEKYTTYDMQLDGSIWIKDIYPHFKWPNGKINGKHDDGLASFYKSHSESLEGLLGNYISAYFGVYKHFHTTSTDIVSDFIILLAEANGRAFKAKFPIYDFLKRINRSLNPDGSIRLRGSYSGYNVDSENLCYPNTIDLLLKNYKTDFDKAEKKAFQFDFSIYNILKRMKFDLNKDNSITLTGEYSIYNVSINNICYPNTKEPNTLTSDNIDRIWEHFFCNKKIESTSTLKSETTKWYSRDDCSIYISYEKYHDRSETKTDISRGKHAILRIGDALDAEHIQFLCEDAGNNAPEEPGYCYNNDSGDDDGPDVTDWALTDDEKGAFRGWASGTPLGGWGDDT